MKRIIIRAVIILTLSLALIDAAYAQLMPYRQYTVKDGLPSSNIYSITQDSTGFIWLGTDNGLCRFDGYEFVKIDEVGEVGQNEVISVFHHDNKIIAGCYNSDLFTLENFNRHEKHKMPNGNTYDKIVCFESKVLVMNKDRGLLKYNTSTKKSITLKPAIDSSKFKPYDISINSMGIVAIAHSSGISLLHLDVNNSSMYSILTSYSKIDCLKWTDANSIFFSTMGKILSLNINNNNIDTIYSGNTLNKITGFDVTGNSIYMIAEYPNQLYYHQMNLAREEVTPIRLGINASINSIFIDKTNGVWAGTGNNGLIYMKKEGIKEIYKVPKELGPINVIHSYRDSIIYVGCKNGLGKYEEEKFEALFPELLKEQNYIRNISSSSNNVFVSTINTNITNGPHSYVIYHDKSKSNIHFVPSSSIANFSNDTLAIGNWLGDVDLITLSGSKINNIKKLRCKPGASDDTRNRVNGIEITKSGIYAATEHGLFFFKHDQSNGRKLSSEVFNHLTNVSDTLVLGAYGNGIIKISNHLNLVDVAIPRKTIYQKLSYAFLDNDQNLWLASNMGVYVLSKNTQHIFNYSTSNGLPENEVKYITTFRDEIAIATNSYLVFLTGKLDWSNIAETPTICLVQIDEYLDNGAMRKKDVIREYVRSLTIKYTTFNYSNPEAMTYKYSVDGTDWVTTKSNEIELSSLGFGEHNIEIMASYYGGEFGPKSTIEVYMLPPLWRSNFFYLLALFSISAFIYHVLKSRQGILKYHSRGFLHNQLLIENLKTRSGVNNLNPHFIYNALNSIKDFLTKNSLKSSFSYIDQFSKLIRLNISGSQEMGVSIHDEIKRLRHYLDLEKLRHDIPFDYEFIVDKKIDMKLTWIPSMIIQPFIENITWYGFQDPVKKGEISIEFVRDVENIMVHIKDNGIGIKNARERQIKHHKSMGTSLVHSKLTSLDPFTEDIILVKDALAGEKYPGTWATITLTPKMYMELKRRKLSEK